ncbi:hypothetical protein J2S05_000255 [Alkalicoccobacillus murimartini]|uniref:Uncharacterized protein n=1 Tax=Alkalicoccobacillus murimartini TaxID=171685 RepID=A0ABT9YCN3_9BACI|nr:hypothetical protein [Alkalicoccobacillus murimartini]
MRGPGRGFIIFNALIFYVCFIFGTSFLLMKGKDFIKYDVSPGPVPILTVLSLIGAIWLTYRYKVMKKRGF